MLIRFVPEWLPCKERKKARIRKDRKKRIKEVRREGKKKQQKRKDKSKETLIQ